MTAATPAVLPGDKLRKAVQEFAELCRLKSEQEKRRIFGKIVIKYDLSPRECTYLENSLLDSGQDKCD